MSNKKIFCNVPWTNTHIYWDGSFGACCSEKSKPYPEHQWNEFNLKNYSVVEWYNSAPMQTMRQQIRSDNPLPQCKGCYYEEQHNYESRRIKENFKSVIFTQQAFDKSYSQTHWHNRFESDTTSPPIDWHVDLGNECNLACKMCKPSASSLFADKYRKWNIEVDVRKNWTSDDLSWVNFIRSVDSTNINRLHFMGGEPMLSKRFRELVDYLIDKKRHTNISISFVTNGTILDRDFINKLQTFKSFDIEISLESIYSNNSYIRQGSDTSLVLQNIQTLIQQQTDTFHVVLRSVPQLLNINNYDQYILWAWNNKVAVQGIPLTEPDYLKINVLPIHLRKQFVIQYEHVKDLIQQQATTNFNTMTVGRDPSRLDIQLIKECESMINLLNQPEPTDVVELRTELSKWLMRWDKEYELDARIVYPEYLDFLNEIGYEV